MFLGLFKVCSKMLCMQAMLNFEMKKTCLIGSHYNAFSLFGKADIFQISDRTALGSLTKGLRFFERGARDFSKIYSNVMILNSTANRTEIAEKQLGFLES